MSDAEDLRDLLSKLVYWYDKEGHVDESWWDAAREATAKPRDPQSAETKCPPEYEVFAVYRESAPTFWQMRALPDLPHRTETQAIAAAWAHRKKVQASARSNSDDTDATALEGLLSAWKSCRCSGTGKRMTDCTLCGDSTFDHECNDRKVDCESCKPIVAAIARVAARKGASHGEG